MLDKVNKSKRADRGGNHLIRHKRDCGRLRTDSSIADLADGIMTLADWARECVSGNRTGQADAALRAIWRYADAMGRASGRK